MKLAILVLFLTLFYNKMKNQLKHNKDIHSLNDRLPRCHWQPYNAMFVYVIMSLLHGAMGWFVIEKFDMPGGGITHSLGESGLNRDVSMTPLYGPYKGVMETSPYKPSPYLPFHMTVSFYLKRY